MKAGKKGVNKDTTRNYITMIREAFEMTDLPAYRTLPCFPSFFQVQEHRRFRSIAAVLTKRRIVPFYNSRGTSYLQTPIQNSRGGAWITGVLERETLCPGRFVARYTLFTFVAMLLQRFDVELPVLQKLPSLTEGRPLLGVMGADDDLAIKLKPGAA